MDLKARRLELGLTLEEVGDAVGVGKSTVRKWENGDIANIKQDKIAGLSNILRFDPLYLIYDDYQPEKSISNIYHQLTPPRQDNVYTYAKDQLKEQHLEETSDIYVVGKTAAGQALAYGDDTVEKINTHVPQGADYALTVQGDSMTPLIPDGAIIFYKEQPTLENGEIGIIEIDHNEVTCKKFYKHDDKIVLRSLNRQYKDIELTDVPIRIIGKVII